MKTKTKKNYFNMETKEVFRFESREAYLTALDSAPPESYIAKRDISNGVHLYIPIPVKEALADALFHNWNIVSNSFQNLINELICIVELEYTPSYPGADIQRCVGAASVPIQMSAGSKVSDFPAKKITNSLEYNLPSVREEAIGNALGTLGNIFGRSLNRKIGKIKIDSNFKIRSFSNGNEADK